LAAYEISNLGIELRQGEIISSVVQYEFNSDTSEAEESRHGYIIVAHQDCDLLREFEKTSRGEPSVLNGIILLPLSTFEDLRPTLGAGATGLVKDIRSHQRDRYHCLSPVEPNLDLQAEGIGELFADFRNVFTIGPQELMRQISHGHAKRRCFLANPYREHFQSRFSFYQQRVALP
jgi:hypothetical protein